MSKRALPIRVKSLRHGNNENFGFLSRYRLGNAGTLVLLIVLGYAVSGQALEDFRVDDYLSVHRIQDIALSSDGQTFAYAILSNSSRSDKLVRSVLVSSTLNTNAVRLIADIQDARQFDWIPQTTKLAFIANRGDAPQVYSYDVCTYELEMHTYDDPVVAFTFSPDGKSLAYITQNNSTHRTLYEQFQNGTSGIRVDSNILRVQHFTDPNWHDSANHRSKRKLWLKSTYDNSSSVPIFDDVKTVHWSSDSQQLSITRYLIEQSSVSLLDSKRSDIVVYNIGNRAFFGLWSGALEYSNGLDHGYYDAGWLPGENKLLLLRSCLTDVLICGRHPEWSIVEVFDQQFEDVNSLAWHTISRSGLDQGATFFPLPNGELAINKTLNGGYQSVFSFDAANGLSRSTIGADLNGNISKLQFDAASEKAIFVHDSFTRPPEIYLWDGTGNSKQITELNIDFITRPTPIVREVYWTGTDGVKIQGWLFLPDNSKTNETLWPLITFVHGGPNMPMPTDFAGYFSLWPYPFELYALNGMAVFMPNYRGSTTFGKEFANPQRIDGEPVDDIVSGIGSLLDMGLFDPDRLGISGHSHGAWLAPVVMTRMKKFQAGSFADGAGNRVTVYDTTSDRLNRELHDTLYGASLYNDPQRYIALSPTLHFEGLTAASLFEAGSRSLAINMIGYPKAAIRAGMPNEFIIYPQTGHNPNNPEIMMESAERNLDWFIFWLKDEEDADPAKARQYARWRKMRDERCAKKELEKPSYCPVK